MHAMILAAGRGERMRPLTDTTPKPLLLVGGKPIIVWHITRLACAGFTHIVINHAWLGDQIESVLGNGADYGVHITYSPEGEGGLETAGGIANALPLLGNAPFLVVNGDILTDYPFYNLRKIKLSQARLAHLVMVDNPLHHPQGDWGIQADLATPIPPYFTFSGIGLYHPSLFIDTPANKKAALLPLFLKGIKAQQISAEYYSGQWLDIGTVERLAMANEIVRNG
jgi:MurNAc alpha-1-phosphate uridylyltransferase